MNNAIYNFPTPINEPVKTYLRGSKEREELEKELRRQSTAEIEIPAIIGGREYKTGDLGKIKMPHNHNTILAKYHKVDKKGIEKAIKCAVKANKEWAELAWTVRASIMLKAAELISTK